MSSPRLVVFAGPNGSGKTTLMSEMLRDGFKFGVYINPDEIAARLFGPYAFRVRTAQFIANKWRDVCIRKRRDFTFETVMSHESKIDVMRRARDAGFHVTLLFVGTDDPAINVARVNARVQLGGHSVPEDRIVARYHRTMRNLIRATATADRTILYDNSCLWGSVQLLVELQREDVIDPARHSRNANVLRGFSEAIVSSPALPRWIREFFDALSKHERSGTIKIKLSDIKLKR